MIYSTPNKSCLFQVHCLSIQPEFSKCSFLKKSFSFPIFSRILYFQACIVYRLKSGRIVYQQEVQSGSENNLCHQKPSFLQDVIRTNFGEEGTAMCCRQDGCNKDVPHDFERNSQVLFLEDFDRDQGHHQQQPKPYEKADYRASAAILALSVHLTLLGIFLSCIIF